MTDIPQATLGPSADKRYFPRWQVKNRVVYRYDGDFNFH